MIEDATRKMSESGSSAESLLSFLNTASSSVKNVLARPGCFKRNTNHRRFLQKQLKVTTQRTEPSSKQDIPKKQFALSKIKQRNATRRRAEAALSEIDQLRSINVKNCLNNLNKSQLMSKRNVIDPVELQKEMQYLDECKRFSAMVDDLVDNLLDSSSQRESQQRLLEEEQPTHPYIRSGSVSSYSSSSEEEMNPDFLSGEELVRSLDISELFIPEGHASPLDQRLSSPEHSDIGQNDFQVISGDESSIDEHGMYETDLIDVQRMPVFENVFRQFSL